MSSPGKAGTISGARAARAIDKADTGAGLKTWATLKGYDNMSNEKQGAPRRKVQVVSPNESLELLMSAVEYMRAAGLAVKTGNTNDGRLLIVIEQAEKFKTSDGIVFRSSAPSLVSKVKETKPEKEKASQAQPELTL